MSKNQLLEFYEELDELSEDDTQSSHKRVSQKR